MKRTTSIPLIDCPTRMAMQWRLKLSTKVKALKKATKEGYFKYSPAEELPAKVGGNKKLEEILTAEEYSKLAGQRLLHFLNNSLVYTIAIMSLCERTI